MLKANSQLFPVFLKEGNDPCLLQLGDILFKEEPAIKTPQGRFTDSARIIVQQTLCSMHHDGLVRFRLRSNAVPEPH